MSLPELEVFVHDRPVATLATRDGHRYSLTYAPRVPAEDFVSLVMPVRPQSWDWPALHPFFQMNLPEGFLLSVLREQLGPLLGASPLDLLAVVGGNMIGRVSLAPLPPRDARAQEEPVRARTPSPELSAAALEGLLHGERSGERFLDLVSTYSASGVSGVVPKFLSPELARAFRKASMRTSRHILKGSSEHTPYLALNEHLCMQVAARAGAETARTEISDDGTVLKVDRFDIADDGKALGFEDLCSLQGLSPDRKYESTWERVTRVILTFVAPEHKVRACQQLALQLLLNYALGNADCHTKNLALIYSSRTDVRLAPIYDLLSIRVYGAYAQNSLSMFLAGRKVWTPGEELPRFLHETLGLAPAAQRQLLTAIGDAMLQVLPELLRNAHAIPDFMPWAARMAHEWQEGLNRLAVLGVKTLPDIAAAARAEGIEPQFAPPLPPRRFGESELLGHRGPRDRRPS